MASPNTLVFTADAVTVLGVSRATFDRYCDKAGVEPDLRGRGRTSAQWWGRATINKIAKANNITPDWSAVES